MSRPLVIYHKNCDDGFGAAFAAWKKLGDGADYLPMDYHDDAAAAALDGRDVIAIDFCFAPAIAEKDVLPRVASLKVIDHHQSALRDWQAHLGQDAAGEKLRHRDGKLDLFFDLGKSGAYLAWEHFHAGEALPRMIAHISDVDLWQFDLQESRAFSCYLRSLPRDLALWDKVYHDMQDAVSAARVIETGRRIESFYQRQIDTIIAADRAREITIAAEVDGKPVTAACIAVNASKEFCSDLGNALASRTGHYAIVWETDGETAHCSMRATGDKNCIPFASAHGGGGHALACGFSVPLDNLTRAIRGEAPL
jgi:hypothetical protein